MTAHVAFIGAQRQHEEYTTEHVLALSHPCDRFNVQRMNGKQGGDKGALPKCAGHLSEHEKEQQHCYCMKKNIREMMTTGVETKQLAVDHVRERRERVPIGCMTMRESPNQPLCTQAIPDN